MTQGGGISIILCCYNSRAVLEQTLKHLAHLDIPANLAVELIVVDNASTDNTPEKAGELWQKFGSPFPMSILPEMRQGLIYARKTGIENSCHPYLLFVDDDNWLKLDYLKKLIHLFENHPRCGAAGGLNTPVFEGEKPFWFGRFQHSYAVGKLAADFGEPDEIGLFGAGLAIRRQALEGLYNGGFRSCLVGRSGEALSSGEDYELCKALWIAGWEVLYDPELRLDHFITAKRLSWDYFRKLNVGISRSIVYFLAYEYWIEKLRHPLNPLVRVKYSWLVTMLRKLIKALLLKSKLILNPRQNDIGSKLLIDFERTKVVFNDLLTKRKEYIALKKEIKQANWRKR